MSNEPNRNPSCYKPSFRDFFLLKFWLNFILSAYFATTPARNLRKPLCQMQSLGYMKILVVDDEKDVQRLFEQRFRKERRRGKLEFYFAFSAEEALEFLDQGGYSGLNMVLSDINMPEMSGLELLSTIRKKYPTLKFYIVTAYGDECKRRTALELGATDYLTKPLDFKNLRDVIFSLC